MLACPVALLVMLVMLVVLVMCVHLVTATDQRSKLFVSVLQALPMDITQNI